MSYVLKLWEPLPGESKPDSVDDAMRQLEVAGGRAETPRATFALLLKRLTRRYPDITSRRGMELPQEEWAWSDGPLSPGDTAVFVLGLNTPMCDQVQPFVVEQANKLGLHVADEQAGEVYLAGGELLTISADGCRARAKVGDVTAMRELAQRYLDAEGVRKDPRQAAHWFGLAAEAGDAQAQSQLGLMFERGVGVLRNKQQALHWFRCAATQGHAGAQYSLALHLRSGNGDVAPDPAEAFRWCSLAAAQGVGFALRVLGQMHEGGEGTPRDIQAAIRCYREATEKGSSSARNNLATLYAQGIGVPLDLDEAQRIYKEGVRVGEAACMSGLATLFNRTGRPADQVHMLALRIQAARADAAGHAGILQVLRDTLAPDVVAEAEGLAQAEDIVAAIEARLAGDPPADARPA